MPNEGKNKMLRKKGRKCAAGVKVEKCFWQEDKNYFAGLLANNDKVHQTLTEHLDVVTNNQIKVMANQGLFTTELHSLTHIKLNGDNEETTFQDMMKEIYHATAGLRASNKIVKDLKEWKINTKTGRFFNTNIGKGAAFIILILTLISWLHTLGLIQSPIRFIENAIRAYFKLTS
jgi:hypothetical protein